MMMICYLVAQFDYVNGLRFPHPDCLYSSLEANWLEAFKIVDKAELSQPVLVTVLKTMKQYNLTTPHNIE